MPFGGHDRAATSEPAGNQNIRYFVKSDPPLECQQLGSVAIGIFTLSWKRVGKFNQKVSNLGGNTAHITQIDSQGNPVSGIAYKCPQGEQ